MKSHHRIYYFLLLCCNVCLNFLSMIVY
ncbi:TPA: hypothetical protein ACKROX_002165 [Proteus mirabilis]|nr:hypothetical protein [Proteus sp. G2675]HEK0649274.1 hypothetical protein [Proteus mirabilis]HEK2693012.1 hypothetical protein [Proteus mirabilis]